MKCGSQKKLQETGAQPGMQEVKEGEGACQLDPARPLEGQLHADGREQQRGDEERQEVQPAHLRPYLVRNSLINQSLIQNRQL